MDGKLKSIHGSWIPAIHAGMTILDCVIMKSDKVELTPMAKLHLGDELIFNVEIPIFTVIGAIRIAIAKIVKPFTIRFGHQSDWTKRS